MERSDSERFGSDSCQGGGSGSHNDEPGGGGEANGGREENGRGEAKDEGEKEPGYGKVYTKTHEK